MNLRRRFRMHMYNPYQIFTRTMRVFQTFENISLTVSNRFGGLSSDDSLTYVVESFSKVDFQVTSSALNRTSKTLVTGVMGSSITLPNDSYDLQLASAPPQYRYSLSNITSHLHCPDINPSYTKVPIYNIPMSPHMTDSLSTNSNIVTASFGMQYLVGFQQRAYDNRIPLTTYTYADITKESFEAIIALAQSKAKTVFTHLGDKFQKHYEFLMEDGFISIEHTSKIPTEYYINNGIMTSALAEEFHPLIKLKPKAVEVQWVDRITSTGDLNIKTIPVPRNKTFVEEAYPFLNDISLEDFIKGYLESDSAVLLLYGAPGTGKTSLLKQILYHANESCLITYNKDIANMDSLFSHFYDSEERFLIIEDADTYINSRQKDGNEVMKKLLNITDGLTAKKEKKVIFTSNLNNLADVDEALLREGRCYAAIPVGAMLKEQATKVLNKLNRSDLISSLPDQITLANLFALLAGRREDQSTESVSTGFGFGPQQ